MLDAVTESFLIALGLSVFSLLATIFAGSKHKALYGEINSLGPYNAEKPMKKLKRARAVWRWAAHIFSLLTLVPLTISAYFILLYSPSTGIILASLGSVILIGLWLYLLNQASKIAWGELFPAELTAWSCIKLMTLGFIATLTVLTMISIISDEVLRKSLFEKLKKAAEGT